jgi:hypothetical protein
MAWLPPGCAVCGACCPLVATLEGQGWDLLTHSCSWVESQPLAVWRGTRVARSGTCHHVRAGRAHSDS